MSRVKTNIKTKANHYEYDVTLSFAGQDRAFVAKVVEHLRNHKVRFFYDDDHRVKLWGLNLNIRLDEIYRKEARYCVMFISEDYKKNRWTKFERIRAQARDFFEENKVYILPFRLDNTIIEEMEDSLVFLSIDQYDEKQLAEAILERIKEPPSRRKIIAWSIKSFFSNKFKAAVMLGIFIGVTGFLLRDKFTPVDVLTQRIHERSKFEFKGAICNDGWPSHSQHHQGTCSHHGGVRIFIDSMEYSKSMEQCKAEAMEISWVAH